MEESWKKVIEFNDKYFPNWRSEFETIFASNALAGEVGEVCNKVKKLYGGGTNNRGKIRSADIVEECTDVFIYMVLLVESLKLDHVAFKSIFEQKLRTLERRMSK
jgi:NTP pyrophosphatase (non-canonical NTP hydrolase)